MSQQVPNPQEPSSPSSDSSMTVEPATSPSTSPTWRERREPRGTWTATTGSSPVPSAPTHVDGALTGDRAGTVLDSTIDQMDGLKLTESHPEQQGKRSLTIPHVTVSEVEDEDDQQRMDVVDADSASINRAGLLIPRPEAPKASFHRKRKPFQPGDGRAGDLCPRGQQGGGSRPDRPLMNRSVAGRIGKFATRKHGDRTMPLSKEESEMWERMLKEGGFWPEEHGSSHDPMM